MASYLQALCIVSVTMGLLSVALWGLTPLLRRRYSARCLAIAWLIVLVGFLVPFRPQPAKPVLTVSLPPARAFSIPAAPPAQPEAAAPQTQPEEEVMQATAQQQRIAIPWATILFAAWAAGTACVLGARLWQHARFTHTLRRWRRPCPPAIWRVMEAEKARLGIRRRVRLVRCPAIDSPLLVGLLWPTVCLPAREISDESLALVLRHELVHLRRGDVWARAVALLASAMHWFNPAVRLAAQGLLDQSEAACDAAVLQGLPLDTRAEYGRTILTMLRGHGMTTALSTRYAGGKRRMKKRLMDIMGERGTRVGALVLVAVLLLGLGGGMVVAFANTETTDADTAPLAGETLEAYDARMSAIYGAPTLRWPNAAQVAAAGLAEAEGIDWYPLYREPGPGDITREEAIEIAYADALNRLDDPKYSTMEALRQLDVGTAFEAYRNEDANIWRIVLYDGEDIVYSTWLDGATGALPEDNPITLAQQARQPIVDEIIARRQEAQAEQEALLGPFYTWTVKQKSDFDVQWRVEPYIAAGFDITNMDFFGYPPEGGLTDAEVLAIARQALLDIGTPEAYLDGLYTNVTYWTYGHPDEHNDIDWTINFEMPDAENQPVIYQGYVALALDGAVTQADFAVYDAEQTFEAYPEGAPRSG